MLSFPRGLSQVDKARRPALWGSDVDGFKIAVHTRLVRLCLGAIGGCRYDAAPAGPLGPRSGPGCGDDVAQPHRVSLVDQPQTRARGERSWRLRLRSARSACKLPGQVLDGGPRDWPKRPATAERRVDGTVKKETPTGSRGKPLRVRPLVEGLAARVSFRLAAVDWFAGLITGSRAAPALGVESPIPHLRPPANRKVPRGPSRPGGFVLSWSLTSGSARHLRLAALTRPPGIVWPGGFSLPGTQKSAPRRSTEVVPRRGAQFRRARPGTRPDHLLASGRKRHPPKSLPWCRRRPSRGRRRR